MIGLATVAARFRTPLRTADDEIRSRTSLLLAITEGEHTGWGEAATFPSGIGGRADAARTALEEWARDPSTLPEVPIARVAVEAARMDLAARAAGLPLHRRLGGSDDPVPARHPIGLSPDIGGLLDEVGAAARAGVTRLKLKVAPGMDVEQVRALRSEFPGMDVAVDANGSYPDLDHPSPTRLDELGVTIIEQPFHAADLVSHRLLQDRVEATVCLDESVRTTETAAMAMSAGAGRMIAVKLGRHGWSNAVTILEQARGEGFAVKAGGTFDTAVGRRHLLAFATLDGVTDAEVAPPSGYLEDAFGEYPDLVDGTVTPSDEPGIGMDPAVETMILG